MTFLRRCILKILIAGLLCLVPLLGAFAGCLDARDKRAFDVQALKTTMMLTALSCGQHSDYNAVMKRFRGDFSSEGRRVQQWFSKTPGQHGRSGYDRYITELANQQSKAGIVELGAGYCEENQTLFSELKSLKQGSELADYAARKNFTQASPVAVLEACVVQASR